MKKSLILLSAMVFMMMAYQNCSMYQSEGKDMFTQLVNGSSIKGCMPYIDINSLSVQLFKNGWGPLDILDISQSYSPDGSDVTCIIKRNQGPSPVAFDQEINCKVSPSNVIDDSVWGLIVREGDTDSAVHNCPLVLDPQDCNENLFSYYDTPNTSFDGRSYGFMRGKVGDESYLLKAVSYKSGSRGASCATFVSSGIIGSVFDDMKKRLFSITEEAASHSDESY